MAKTIMSINANNKNTVVSRQIIEIVFNVF